MLRASIAGTAGLLFLLFSLTGCYEADRELISADDADFPFSRITYTTGGETRALVRADGAYRIEGEDDLDAGIRFLRIDEGTYVAQVSGEGPDGPVVLLALVTADFATGTAEAHVTWAGRSAEAAGFARCSPDSFCVPSLEAYIAHARAEMAAGAEPDASYRIAVEP